MAEEEIPDTQVQEEDDNMKTEDKENGGQTEEKKDGDETASKAPEFGDDEPDVVEPMKKPAAKGVLKKPAAKITAIPKKKSKAQKPEDSQTHEVSDEDEEKEAPKIVKKPAANVKEHKGSKGNTKGSMQKTKQTKKDHILKKPAASTSTTSKKAQMMSQFEMHDEKKNEKEEGEEEEEKEEDEEIDPGLARDRSKSVRFFNMMKKSELPEAVLEAWKACTSRMKQTSLINNLFEKRGKNYHLKPEIELPEVYQKRRETEREDKAEDVQSGFGETIFCKKHNLSKEELQLCVQTGEVRSWKSGNVWLYAAVNVKVSSGVAKKTTENLQTREHQLDQESAQAFLDVFNNLEPDVTIQDRAAGEMAQSLAAPSGRQQFPGSKRL